MSWRSSESRRCTSAAAKFSSTSVLDLVDLLVQIVDQVEVALGDDVGQVEGDLAGRNVLILAGLLQLGRIERLPILGCPPHGERLVAG